MPAKRQSRQRLGTAIANIISGAYNPSGKLPITFPRSAATLPSYYSFPNGECSNSLSSSHSERVVLTPATMAWGSNRRGASWELVGHQEPAGHRTRRDGA